ncbi:MAG: hypothetical protein WBA73_14015 [Devosia sp.]
MSIARGLRDWWTLKRLEREERRTSLVLSAKQRAVSAQGGGWERLQEETAEEDFEHGLASAAIDLQLNKMLVSKARRLRIPVPDRKSTDDWEEIMTGGKVLTQTAALRLRREIALELETQQKPYLNWGALVLSLFSLGVSIIAILGGGD